MSVQAFWQSVEASGLGSYIAASTWAFPTFETIHVMAIVTVVGSIAVMDLRLLGLASTDRPMSEVSRDTLPMTWAAFAVAVIAGSLLFISKASEYAVNPNFQIKMALIALAGVNMAVFHLFTWKSVKTWDNDKAAPLPGRIAAGASLAIWITVVFFARAVGFTLDLYASNF